jgi:hypothetical protein
MVGHRARLGHGGGGHTSDALVADLVNRVATVQTELATYTEDAGQD